MTIAVLHLRSSRGLHGPERHLLELAPALREVGVASEVALLLRPRPAGPPHPFQMEAEARGERVHRVADPGRWPAAAAEAVTQLLAGRRFDLLHAHDFKANAVALRVAARHRLPAVATFHLHTHGSARLRLYELLDSWQLGRFDAVVAVAAALREAPGLRRVAPSRLAVVPNGIDAARLEAAATRDWYAAAALLAAAGGGPVILAVAGAGPEGPRLARLASELGLDRRVRWLGARTEIAGLLCAADLVAVPSRSEGLPYVVLEALALGRPVAAAAVGGVPELVRDGEEGWLVPPGDVEALTAALASALAVPDERARRAAAGCRRVRESFHARGMAEQTAAIYRRLAA